MLPLCRQYEPCRQFDMRSFARLRYFSIAMPKPGRNQDIRVFVREAGELDLPPHEAPFRVREMYRQVWDNREFRSQGCRLHLSITMVDLSDVTQN